MRDDVRFAALRAAAKVALSMTMITGCSATPGNEDGAAASTTDELNKSATPPCDGGGGSPASCSAVLASAFPEPGDYRWEPEKQSKEVVTCCEKEIAANGSGSKYRWDCCVAYNDDVLGGEPVSSQHGVACTPWGPPVPPSMDRLRAKRAAHPLRAVA